MISGPSTENFFSSAVVNPTFKAPPMIAMVAGIAPVFRIMVSTSWAISKLAGYGMPWAMMVDSNATTGLPSASAVETSLVHMRCLFIAGINTVLKRRFGEADGGRCGGTEDETCGSLAKLRGLENIIAFKQAIGQACDGRITCARYIPDLR